eukprot:c17227_g2_i1 orf=130-366(-)
MNFLLNYNHPHSQASWMLCSDLHHYSSSLGINSHLPLLLGSLPPTKQASNTYRGKVDIGIISSQSPPSFWTSTMIPIY